MTELAIFGFGSILFLATTWAAIAFGVHRVHELQLEDFDRPDGVTTVKEEGLIELHLTDLPSDAQPFSERS